MGNLSLKQRAIARCAGEKEKHWASFPCFPRAPTAQVLQTLRISILPSAPGSCRAAHRSAMSSVLSCSAFAKMLQNWDPWDFYHYLCIYFFSVSTNDVWTAKQTADFIPLKVCPGWFVFSATALQSRCRMLGWTHRVPAGERGDEPSGATLKPRVMWEFTPPRHRNRNLPAGMSVPGSPRFLHFDFELGAALLLKCLDLYDSDGLSWLLKSVFQSCICAAFPCWASTLPEKKNNQHLILYFIYFLFFFFFFSFIFFLRENLKATDAIKGVVHFLSFTTGALKTLFFFFFYGKTFCKNQHVNKKPLQPQRPCHYFLVLLSLVGRWDGAEGASSSSATPPWG